MIHTAFSKCYQTLFKFFANDVRFFVLFYEVKEGDNLEFKVDGRVIIAGLGHEISIENLKDFPGMVFNQATGEVKWKPNLDFVKTGGEVLAHLKILMVTTGGKTLIRRKEVGILVLRQFVVRRFFEG